MTCTCPLLSRTMKKSYILGLRNINKIEKKLQKRPPAEGSGTLKKAGPRYCKTYVFRELNNTFTHLEPQKQRLKSP